MTQTLDDRIAEPIQEDVERRSSRRMPPPGGDNDIYHIASLRRGSKKIAATILDESAGGFLVEVDGHPALDKTKPVELISVTSRQMLNIVWMRELEGKTRIGLQRAPEHLEGQGDASWFIWLLAAILFGLCLGYLMANKDGRAIARRFQNFTGSSVSNTHVDNAPSQSLELNRTN